MPTAEVMDISESATAEPLHIFKSCLDANVSTGIAAIQGLMQVRRKFILKILILTVKIITNPSLYKSNRMCAA